MSGDVNYAGHYRIVLTKNGDFPIECSNDVWVCGRVIDKPTGEVVSELLQFNNKTQYYATIDNGTPVSDSFDIVFYAKSSMLWLYGMTKPVKGNWTETKCARVAYNFINNKFIPIGLWRCETDVGEEKIRILTCLDVFNYA